MARGEGLEILKERIRTVYHDKNEIYKFWGKNRLNTKVIPVAACLLSACKFTGGELKALHQVVKRQLRSKNMLETNK